jgi:hypothetical protein
MRPLSASRVLLALSLAACATPSTAGLTPWDQARKGFSDTVYDRDLREMLDDANRRVGLSYLEQRGQNARARLAAALAELTPYYDTRPFGK